MEWSKEWNASKKPGKQRKYRLKAPTKIRHGFLSAHLSAELRKKKEELRKRQREDILSKFDSLGLSAKKDTPKLQEKTTVSQQSQTKQSTTTDRKLNQPLTKSSFPPQSAAKPAAAKQDAAKQDPFAALAKTVKGKSGNAIEELRKKVKK